MPYAVTMPKLGLTMTEGLVSRWLVADGDQVKAGEPIAEIETDKVTSEIVAERDGSLKQVISAGSSVEVTGVMGYLLGSGETVPDASQPRGSTAKEPTVVPTDGEAAASAEPDGSSAPVVAAPAAKRRAKELGILLGQVTGSGAGGRVTLADVETFAVIRKREAETVAEIRATPLVRRIAQDVGIDLGNVRGTGEGGRILKEDVERANAEAKPHTPSAVPPAAAPRQLPAPAPGELVPIKGIRAVIAESMLASSRQTAAVTLTTECDATELVNMRDQLNQGLAESTGVRISYSDFFVKIVGKALREFPYMNARQEGENIRLLADVHVGVAVDSPQGLLVPVVRDADRLSVVQVGRRLKAMIGRALEGKSHLDDLRGGTFTITNLGMMGVDAFTPIINPPQLAVLGIGRIAERPAAHRGKVRLRHTVVLSLTFDHRLVDGAPAAHFLRRIKWLVEMPYQLLIDADEVAAPAHPGNPL